MNSISYLLTVEQFQQMQFEVEQKLKRVLDPHKVAEHLISKGISVDVEAKVLLHLDAEFLSQFPSFIDRVILDGSVIPSEIPVYVRKKRYRISGEVWVVHQNDVDPFPSSPHAHNYDENLVMHLGNGKLYRKREYITTAKQKKFIQLRELIKNIQLPPLEITP